MSEPLACRDPLFLRLLQMLHEGFVEARRIGYATGDERLTDLGDTFEIIPELMLRWDDESGELIRQILRRYHAKHGGRDYGLLLDMADDEFRKRYPGPWEPSSETIDVVVSNADSNR